jgi:hypothetical protein
MWPESRMIINQTADWSNKDGEINISPDNIEVRISISPVNREVGINIFPDNIL